MSTKPDSYKPLTLGDFLGNNNPGGNTRADQVAKVEQVATISTPGDVGPGEAQPAKRSKAAAKPGTRSQAEALLVRQALSSPASKLQKPRVKSGTPPPTSGTVCPPMDTMAHDDAHVSTPAPPVTHVSAEAHTPTPLRPVAHISTPLPTPAQDRTPLHLSAELPTPAQGGTHVSTPAHMCPPVYPSSLGDTHLHLGAQGDIHLHMGV